VEAAGAAWPLGTSSTIHWPASSLSAKGNGGVAQIVKSTPGAIGYVDYATAKGAGLTFASIKNKDGDYVAPSPESAALAASQVVLKPNETFSAIWAGGNGSYPITYQSWDLVDARQPNANDASMLRAYIGYLLGAGQELLPQLGYAPLPSRIDQQAQAQLSKIAG
jgi:phosphate transport system substrate-binding protein